MIVLWGFLSSFAGSMLSLVIWFHYDLEGWWETKRHRRIMRIGAKLDKAAHTR